MKRTSSILAALAAASLLGACASAPPQPMPGSDRSPQGCIASAGYRWCATTNQCERPWELAKSKGFENTPEAYDKFCGAK